MEMPNVVIFTMTVPMYIISYIVLYNIMESHMTI